MTSVKQTVCTVQAVRAQLSTEWSEVPVVGRTRVLLGPGGKLEGVLTAGEAVALEIRGWGSPSSANPLPIHCQYTAAPPASRASSDASWLQPSVRSGAVCVPSQEDVAAMLAPYGAVKHVVVLRIARSPPDHHQIARSPDVVIVRATMATPAAAARAIQSINQGVQGPSTTSHCTGGAGAEHQGGRATTAAATSGTQGQPLGRLTATPYIPRAVAHVFQSTCVLRLSWSSGVPGRCATIEFESVKGRDAVLKMAEPMPAARKGVCV